MPEVNPHKHGLIQLSSDYWDDGHRVIYWCTFCGTVKDFLKIYSEGLGTLYTYEIGCPTHVSKERMEEFDSE